MKKPIAFVLSAALLTLPVSPAVAFGDTLTETTTVSTTEAKTTDVKSTDTEANSTVDKDSNIDEEGNVVDSDGKVVNPGTLPDSPLYWLDELIEKLQVALAFSPEKKIKLMEKHACERLAEALAIAQKVSQEEAAADTSVDVSTTENTDNTDSNVTDEEAQENTTPQPTNPRVEKKIKAFEKAIRGYDAKIAHAQEFLAQIQDPESEKAQKLQEALAKVNVNNIVVLGSLLEKLPPQAAQRVAVNIVRSMEKAIEKMEKMEAKNKKPAQANEKSDTVGQEDVAQDKDANTAPETETKKIVPIRTSEKIDTSKTNKNTLVPANALSKYATKSQLTKSEYKELRKEAHEALKELQEDLGLKGPHKDKNSDSNDWKKVNDKKADRDRDDNRGKNNRKGEKSQRDNGKS